MKPDRGKELVHEIATLAEVAYRRGYRQGVQLARASQATADDEEQVYRWFLDFQREDAPRYYVCPPLSPWAGQSAPLADMLRCRLTKQRFSKLRALIFEDA